MNTMLRALVFSMILIAPLAACAGPAAPTLDPASIQTTVDAVLTAEAQPTLAAPPTPEPTVVSGPSFEATTYQDPIAGFEFDYPAGWVVGPIQQQSRGGITPFTSWERPTDVNPDATPPGETRMDVVVQLWDPKGDLEAFLAQRKLAWDGSGITVEPQGEWTLSDGRAAKAFLLTGVDGAQGYTFVTTVGENYLTLGGDGDLALLAEIARTVRPIALGN